MKREIIQVGPLEITFLLESQDSNGQISMFEFLVPPGAKVPLPHYHEKFDEVVYGLEGIMTFTIDGNIVDVKPGDSYFIRRGIVHGFNNHQSTNAKALSVITPALLGPEYFRDLAAIINAGGPPDMQKVKEVLHKHGLIAVAPPNP